MRVGFFTKKKIAAGEEITFDYKYERYGQEAQKCFCGSENCRGWLGGEPEKRSGSEDEDEDDDDDDEDDDYWSTSEEEGEEEEAKKDETKVVPPKPAEVKPKTPEVPELETAKETAVVVSETVPEPLVENVAEKDLEPKKIEALDPTDAAKSDLDSSSETLRPETPSAITPSPDPTSKRAEKVKRKRRKRRRSPRKIKNYEEDDHDDEIESLKSSGIRTKAHTVALCRTMVRTTDLNARLSLVELLSNADTPCRRLFLDYNGMKILQGWMAELGWTHDDLDLKLAIEDVLKTLAVPHRTMLLESKVLRTIEFWATARSEADVMPPTSPEFAPPRPVSSRLALPPGSHETARNFPVAALLRAAAPRGGPIGQRRDQSESECRYAGAQAGRQVPAHAYPACVPVTLGR